MGAHKSNIAIGWPFCPAPEVRRLVAHSACPSRRRTSPLWRPSRSLFGQVHLAALSSIWTSRPLALASSHA
jgi:DNA-binding PucR family transcriptional regulator